MALLALTLLTLALTFLTLALLALTLLTLTLLALTLLALAFLALTFLTLTFLTLALLALTLALLALTLLALTILTLALLALTFLALALLALTSLTLTSLALTLLALALLTLTGRRHCFTLTVTRGCGGLVRAVARLIRTGRGRIVGSPGLGWLAPRPTAFLRLARFRLSCRILRALPLTLAGRITGLRIARAVGLTGASGFGRLLIRLACGRSRSLATLLRLRAGLGRRVGAGLSLRLATRRIRTALAGLSRVA